MNCRSSKATSCESRITMVGCFEWLNSFEIEIQRDELVKEFILIGQLITNICL